MRSRQRLPYLFSSVFILKPRFLYGVAHRPRIIYMIENSNFENAVQSASSETRKQIGRAEGKIKWVKLVRAKVYKLSYKIEHSLAPILPMLSCSRPKIPPWPSEPCSAKWRHLLLRFASKNRENPCAFFTYSTVVWSPVHG